MMNKAEFYSKFNWKYFIWCLTLCTVISAVLLAIVSSVDTTPKGHYRAAVVEYSPVVQDTPRKTLSENVARYEMIIEEASHYDVDIIVFPEAGLTTVSLLTDRKTTAEYVIEVPLSKSAEVIPCSDSSFDEVLQRLSCAAKKNAMYTAVNFIEISNCTVKDERCPQDGVFFYNTNVVFDRRGAIIARYRKYNLFEEKTFIDSTEKADLCTFQTDFGVTFGMFICFDLVFHDPSVRLVKEKGITDIIFSTAWYSEMPLLTAVAVHSGWAHSLDVNLLTAGYNDPEEYSGGSGIYAGTRGPLAAYMPRQMGTKLLITNVPKRNIFEKTKKTYPENETLILAIENPNPTDFTAHSDAMKLLRDPSIPLFSSMPLSLSDKEINTNQMSFENNSFSCHVRVAWRNKADNEDYKHYKIVAYSGNRNFGRASRNHVESCGLTLCYQETPTSLCVWPKFDLKNSSIEVVSINIVARSYEISSIPIPSTLNSSMYPLEVNSFTYSSSIVNDEQKVFYNIEMNLVRPVDNLVTFVVYKLPSDLLPDH